MAVACIDFHTLCVCMRVCLFMDIGICVRCSDDLGFDLTGYFMLFLNDICTAGNGVYLKKKLDAKVRQVFSAISE